MTGTGSVVRVLLLSLVFYFPGLLTADDETPPARHVFPSLNGSIIAERVLDGLSQPVAIEFLPDGKALVLQRDRGLVTLADFNSGEKTDVEGLPKLVVFSDAGVHDVELHPEFDKNGWIYITYTEGQEVHSTVVLDRFRLDGAKARDVERIFTADAYSEAAYHFAARIQFVDGKVFVAIGDRQHPPTAQENSNHAGTVVRLNDDGSVPEDNPFVGVEEEGRAKPRPEIWSYGHRDPQGFSLHPETGVLWLHEHGPRGGDELNQVKKGANYGWPVVSYGFQYEGGPIGMGIPWKEGMEIPAWVYVPSIAPSDMVIYQGEAFPAWKDSFLIGAMAGLHLNRLVLRDGEVVAEERLVQRLLGRIRSIAVDKGGLVYLGSDNGEVWRLKPE
ncbi:MAG: PQQ-dependent sugar dehydrogenase [Gammaproteobacteria bacterium]|nr:PQQ-dependent sugar dehydrogenase [Gammaproteobacteria bacterium]